MSAAAIIDVASERASVVAEARRWLGTPFHHAARLHGVGVDCAQFLLAVYCGLGLIDEPDVPGYPADWFIHQDRERFLEALAPHCVRCEQPAIGDIALFKYGRSASHGTIIVAVEPNLAVIHSFRSTGVILEGMSVASPRYVGSWTLRRWVEPSTSPSLSIHSVSP